jgi:deoxyadenosine/deoxycytidine kinase
LENFEENSFLPQFYDEMSKMGPSAYNKYAYPVQMEFLKQRIAREKFCKPREEGVINVIDRCLMEDKFIFAENQRRNNIITENEYLRYEKYFEEHT